MKLVDGVSASIVLNPEIEVAESTSIGASSLSRSRRTSPISQINPSGITSAVHFGADVQAHMHLFEGHLFEGHQRRSTSYLETGYLIGPSSLLNADLPTGPQL